MTDADKLFLDADTNPATAYELGRHDERAAFATAPCSCDGCKFRTALLKALKEDDDFGYEERQWEIEFDPEKQATEIAESFIRDHNVARYCD